LYLAAANRGMVFTNFLRKFAGLFVLIIPDAIFNPIAF